MKKSDPKNKPSERSEHINGRRVEYVKPKEEKVVVKSHAAGIVRKR